MIFWEHIKGLNAINNNSAWTYINFCNNVSQNSDTDRSMTLNPTIGFGNEGYNITSRNYILTSNMTGGYITGDFSFYNSVVFSSSTEGTKTLSVTNDTTKSSISITGALKVSTGGDIDWYQPASTSFNIYHNDTKRFEINSNGNIIMTPNSENVLYKTTSTNKMVVTAGNSLDGSCHAVYFNATSDYRAKKDFKPLQIDALKLVKSIKPYTFKYKDSNLPSIGIIAQDVQDIDLEGFKLVDNENATGENMDYMSIHESKLIYILWKAIQEQQKEIEELKLQLKK